MTVALTTLWRLSPWLGLVYLAICGFSAYGILYAYCAKCNVRLDNCSHVLPGKITRYLPQRKQGPYTFGDVAGTALFLGIIILFPQYWLLETAAALVLFEAQRQRAEAGLYGTARLPEPEFTARLFEWAYPRLAARYRSRGLTYPRLADDGQPAVFEGEEEDAEGEIVNLKLAKHRNGPTGEMQLYFKKRQTRFENVEEDHYAESAYA